METEVSIIVDDKILELADLINRISTLQGEIFSHMDEEFRAVQERSYRRLCAKRDNLVSDLREAIEIEENDRGKNPFEGGERP